MTSLIAEGEGPENRWSRRLPEGESIVIGKSVPHWSVPWERWISQRHAELECSNGNLHLRVLPTAHNPVFFRGEAVNHFSMAPGDYFVIGRTVFSLHTDSVTPASEERPLMNQYALGQEDLRQVEFGDAPHRIDVLGHLTKVIVSAADEQDLFAQTINLLLEGVRRADVVALVAVEEGVSGPTRVLHADQRLILDGEFRPSNRLVREAIVNAHKSVVHIWTASSEGQAEQFTAQMNLGWAFCTPLRGEASKNMGIYVAGRNVTSPTDTLLAVGKKNDLSEDVKFVELVAGIFGALRQMRALQHRQAILSHFFSPRVLRVLSDQNAEQELQPRETAVTVMFCDVRGFSRKVEMSASNLLGVLERVSKALGVMSQCILDRRGVIADFLGDAAMSFWGWPLVQADDVQNACLAALAIRRDFESFSKRVDHPLSDFRVGIGIASGPGVAGQIGSLDQAKVTVFGPSVNLASRLEGLTKILHVPILLDETTAKIVQERIGREVARCRRLAVVKPYGLETPLVVSELLPPEGKGGQLTDQDLQHYDAALNAFLRGDWDAAYEELHHVPASDFGKDLLTSFILQYNHTPPPGFNGVIPIQQKR